MKEWLKERGQGLFYFILLDITFLFFFLAGGSNEDYQFKMHDAIHFDSPWNYEFSDGATGTTELPAHLSGGNSDTLILTNILPEIPDGTSFFYRSRHTNVTMYLDDVCVYKEQELEDSTCFPLPGNYWVEAELNHTDSGKELKIVLNGSVSHYLSGPGLAYLGAQSDFIMQLLRDNAGTIVGASVLFILAFILLILWIMLYIITKDPYNECICLSMFTLSIAMWGYTETKCLQFVFPNMKQFSVFAFEILAITPVPIALYFTYSKREKTRQLANLAATIPLITWIVNNILHFGHVLDISETLIITQVMIVLDAIFIAYIQITDIIYHLTKETSHTRRRYWIVPLFGLCSLIPLLMVDMIRYIRSDENYVSEANHTCLGVVIYIVCLACHSGLRLVAEKSSATSANEAKSQFLANMSHEIRTPLNAILGLDEMILQNTTDPQIVDYASDIQKSGQNLLEIINKILDLSKIEAGKMELTDVSYNTIEMLDNLVLTITPLAEKKNLYFNLEIDPEVPEQLVGDESHIREILVNLLTNAVKYTRVGGFTLKVRLIEHAADTDICKILYAVQDTGVGIKEEDRERLFVKFERLDFRNNMNIEGTGLGMSIVTKLLSAMGSKIQLDSIYGQGSEFSFVLKQKAVFNNEYGIIGDYEAGRQHRTNEKLQKRHFIAPEAHILVVDDVKVNLKVACGLLKPFKIQVDTADSGFEALELIEQNHYDVVLMDHMMPQMSGIETTKCIRQLTDKTGDTYYCKLPILALTAYAMSGMYEKYIEAGLQDFISKPIEEKQLEEVLLKWLPKDKVIYIEEKERTDSSEDNTDIETQADNIEDVSNIQIPGIDIAIAKQYYTDKEGFDDCLRVFWDSIPSTIDKLIEFRRNQDKENYTITVHGIKSSARVIGATEISETARQLEGNCHNGEYETAWNGADHLIDMLSECSNHIKQYFHESGADTQDVTRIISDEEIKNCLDNLKTIAENFDMQGLMDWEKEYASLQVPEENAKEWLAIVESVRNIAFLDIVSEIELFAKHKFNE